MEMLSPNLDYCRTQPAPLLKTPLLLDHGYPPNPLPSALEQRYPQIMRKLQFERPAKPSKVEKAAVDKTGFVPVQAGWVVERSMLGWNAARV